MKWIFNSLTKLAILCLLATGAMFTGCEQSNPFSATTQDAADHSSSLSENFNKRPAPVVTYPIANNHTYTYWGARSMYRGGTLNVEDGSLFQLVSGALTPPPGTPLGQDVTITMQIDRDASTNELIFTFGPHGAQFDPPAKVYLNYSELGIETANLYYIDEGGNYILQSPDYIDITQRSMILSINHFSRYAIGAD